MDLLDWVTLGTAIWGSVTGTIALILRIRDASKDRPFILIRPRFEYSGSFDLNPDVALIVELTNAGRRPTTLDSIRAVYRPSHVWQVPFWWIHRKGIVWLSKPGDRKYNQALEEGKHCEFRFGKKSIWPEATYDPLNLVRILVFDKTGRVWSSPRQFGQHQLREFREAVEISSDDLQGDQRKFEIRLHLLGKRYEIKERYLLGNQYRYQFRTFSNLSLAEDAYAHALERGRQFIEGKIEKPFEADVG